MFIDRVKLTLTAGRGGHGIVAWRREKYIPKGGPAGGNGGPGGNIIIRAKSNLLSLEKFHNKKLFKAENGRDGGPHRQQGRRGKDLILEVPVGTLIKDNSLILHDLTSEGEEYLVCKGGKGGLGNHFFKSSTNQAPNRCTPGKDGQSLVIELELKIIADIGLIGLPNAGKSTLFSKLTKSRAKIGAYPFTTLAPNIGYLEREDYTRIFLADIPGLIENAHLNKGLGFSFLRHIERTSLLVYVLDASEDPHQDFRILQNELFTYSPKLKEMPFIVVLNKMDLEEASKNAADFCGDFPIYPISALENLGLDKLKEGIACLKSLETRS